MTGKEKCKLLKAIRREIAETNGIVYLTSECTFEGECKGTCPKCDAEIRYLDSEINRLIASGKRVSLAGLSLDTFDTAVEAATLNLVNPMDMQFIEPDRVMGNHEMTIEELDLSVRSFNCLKRANINTIGDLISRPVSDMYRIRHLNAKCIEEIHHKLQLFGLDFSSPELTPQKVKHTLYGFAVADALGVPVEFLFREELATNPVTDYRGFGSHPVPAGTWSDDTSMTLATLDSLASGLNYTDIMEKFRNWEDYAAYTATGKVFDIGITTHRAIQNFKSGKSPLSCGCCDEQDNGNGALMRIIPAVFYIRHKMPHAPLHEKLAIIHNISALTHGHPRSKMACGIYYFILDALLDGATKEIVKYALRYAEFYYRGGNSEFASEIDHFTRLFSSDFAATPEDQINTSGYVVDTLEAAVWCLLNTNSYRECVLKAVNLGRDTDTVAAVAGGLAGCLYCGTGESDIPAEWMEKLLKHEQIDELCDQFFNGPAKISVPEETWVVEKGGLSPDKYLDMTIEELDLSVRAFNCLKRANINTVRDLTMMTENELIRVRNLGHKSMEEVIHKLAMMGLYIAEE